MRPARPDSTNSPGDLSVRSGQPGAAELRRRLFVPGDRLGWTFRDRWQFARPFAEAEPLPSPIPDRLAADAEGARVKYARVVRLSLAAGGGLLTLAALVGGAYALTGRPATGLRLFAAAAVAVIIIGLTVVVLSRHSKAVRDEHVRRAGDVLRDDYERRVGDWRKRRADYQVAEVNRVDQLAEWAPVRRPADSRRLDIFGGNVWAWQAFLTVYGTSALAERPVVVVDLSREVVCEELAHSAEASGIGVDMQVLPDQLGSTTLLAGLRPRQIVDALIESMYGEDTNASRADRSSDDRILTTVCAALGTNVSLGRIAAGLRALLDEPDSSAFLTSEERRHIADELFSVEYRNRSKDRLHRLESYIHPLEPLGAAPVPGGPAALTCMALASEGRNVRSELITDLIVQWLTHRIVADRASVPDVIIAGADHIAVRNLERLSDACERRGIRLTLLFRHLRQTGIDVIGGGSVGFMRMGNNVEAGRAADFIGRGHKFVVSQITKTVGGNESHTVTDTVGTADTVGTNTSVSDGVTKSRSKGSSSSAADRLMLSERTFGRNSGTSDSDSVTTSRGGNWSSSRNWSAAKSYADGTNWSDARADQRVYEYTVEPTELQQLPDHVMLLVHHRPGGERLLRPVELDPAIVTLPRVSPVPFPDVPAGGYPIIANGDEIVGNGEEIVGNGNEVGSGSRFGLAELAESPDGLDVADVYRRTEERP